MSSSSRWLWWKEAWRAWERQPWRGTGAGSFELTHRLLRTNNIVVTEPHNVPLQFLSETGVVGFFFAFASIAAAGVGVARRVRGREPAVVALAVLAAAYVLHSLVDFDWDFVAVTGPFLLSVGALLGGPAVRDEPRTRLGAAAGGGGDRGRALAADAVVRGALTTDSARSALADRRPLRRLPRRARRPLAQPAGARPAAHRRPQALEQLGDVQGARQRYIDAVELQPLNWRAWFELGSFEEGQQDFGRAIPALERAVELDPLNSLTTGELARAKSLEP